MNEDDLKSFNSIIISFLVSRLLRTEMIAPQDEPTQENFDIAYEADIEAIVRRILKEN